MGGSLKTKLTGVGREYYILLSFAITLVIVGTVVFHLLEKWSWIDSLYFTVITLATVGYGDLTPTTPVEAIRSKKK
jgi:voltage-gated potassium channel Kch